MQELQTIIKQINELASRINRTVKIMELCGTHSQTVAKYNIKNILPSNIKLITGPGCPICVTDQEDIDNFIGLAKAGIPVAIYGDVLKVPGNNGSLENAVQHGADVNVVYSVDEAINLKKIKKNLVFFGLGFETTTPMTCWAVKKGLCVYSSHKRFIPAMSALLENKNIKIDGFINPGHVSAIIGSNPYENFDIPQVIAGFEAEDVIIALHMLLKQIVENKRILENEYTRLVTEQGNIEAINSINEVFITTDALWRGFGKILGSGLELRDKYVNMNAKVVYKEIINDVKKNTVLAFNACECGLIVQGIKEPHECPLFKKVCTPLDPKGACMVSQEGACNIEYRN